MPLVIGVSFYKEIIREQAEVRPAYYLERIANHCRGVAGNSDRLRSACETVVACKPLRALQGRPAHRYRRKSTGARGAHYLTSERKPFYVVCSHICGRRHTFGSMARLFSVPRAKMRSRSVMWPCRLLPVCILLSPLRFLCVPGVTPKVARAISAVRMLYSLPSATQGTILAAALRKRVAALDEQRAGTADGIADAVTGLRADQFGDEFRDAFHLSSDPLSAAGRSASRASPIAAGGVLVVVSEAPSAKTILPFSVRLSSLNSPSQ